MTGPGHNRLPALEDALAAKLVDHRTQAKFTPEWLAAGTQWSAAIWTEAEALGPTPLDERTALSAVALAWRPVFLCGAHRSGTTLLRDLLDGHPALSVLPAEASYFGAMERAVSRLPREERLSLIGQAWLRRLVNPLNQPPFWLLGRNGDGDSRYVAFARHYRACTTVLLEAGVPHSELAGVACAYALVRNAGMDGARWVEKTPGTERHLGTLLRTFPQAKVIHVVRDPDDAALSYKGLLQRANDDAAPMTAMIRELTRSYRIAYQALGSVSPERYLLIPYARLVADREATMKRVADFLAIADDPALGEQSIAGLRATPNSSHHATRVSPVWTLRERIWLQRAGAAFRKLLRAVE